MIVYFYNILVFLKLFSFKFKTKFSRISTNLKKFLSFFHEKIKRKKNINFLCNSGKFYNIVFFNILNIFILFFANGCVYISKNIEFEYLLDDTKNIEFNEIYSNISLQKKFIKTDALGLGYYSGNVWIRTKRSQPGELIYLDNPTLSEIKFYTIYEQSPRATEKWSGRYIHEKYKDFPIRNPVFITEAGQEGTYYIKIFSESQINFKISIIDNRDIIKEISEYETTFGLMWGITTILLVSLLINFFIKREVYLLLLIGYSLFSFLSYYENWMMVPHRSLSHFFKSSFFDLGLLPLIYITGELFSLEYIKKRNWKLYVLILSMFVLNVLLHYYTESRFFIFWIEIQGVLLSLIFISYIYIIYRSTNFLYSVLLLFWILFGLSHIFNLVKYSYQYTPTATIPLGISFQAFEACILILSIYLREPADTLQVFDPSDYVHPKSKENDDNNIQINFVDNFLSQDEKKIIVASSNLKLKSLILLIKLESSDYEIEAKTKDISSLTHEYLKAYKDLFFVIQTYGKDNILVFARSTVSSIKVIKDIYKYIFYLSISKEIKHLNIVSEERILYLQYDKEIEIYFLNQTEIQSIISLSNFTYKKKLPVVCFENYKIDKKDEVHKRFLGKFKYNFPLERGIWEYLFAEKGNFEYLEMFNQSLNAIEKKDFVTARDYMIKCLEMQPGDEVSLTYVEKLNLIIENPENRDIFPDDLTTLL